MADVSELFMVSPTKNGISRLMTDSFVLLLPEITICLTTNKESFA